MRVCTVHYFRRSVNRINAIASRSAGERQLDQLASHAAALNGDDGGTARRETGQLEPELCYREAGPSRPTSRGRGSSSDNWPDTSAHAAGRS